MKKRILLFVFLIIGAIRSYAAETAKPVITLAGNKGGVSAIAFTKDSKQVITAGADSFMRAWAVKTGAAVYASGQGSAVKSIVYSLKGRYIASAGADSSLKIWNPKDGKLERSAAADGVITSIDFTPDADYIAAGVITAGRGGIKIWQTGGMGKPFALETGGNWAKAMAFSADDRFFLAAGGNTISVWNVEYGDIVSAVSGKGGIKFTNKRDFDFGCMVFDADFSPDSQYFSACGDDGTLKTWRTEDGLIAWKQPSHNGIALSLAFSKEYLATAGRDGMINFFGVKSGRPVFSIAGCPDRANELAFSPDGKYLAASCVDGSVPVWKVQKAAKYEFGKMQAVVFAAGLAGLAGIAAILVFVFRKKKSVKDWEL